MSVCLNFVGNAYQILKVAITYIDPKNTDIQKMPIFAYLRKVGSAMARSRFPDTALFRRTFHIFEAENAIGGKEISITSTSQMERYSMRKILNPISRNH